ncbi:MAG: hypothetical protein AB7L90_09270 [Hyphomicrobiaceae bacterium]
MTRQINRVSVKSLTKKLAPVRFSDGGNLYLVVARGGARSSAFLKGPP